MIVLKHLTSKYNNILEEHDDGKRFESCSTSCFTFILIAFNLLKIVLACFGEGENALSRFRAHFPHLAGRESIALNLYGYLCLAKIEMTRKEVHNGRMSSENISTQCKSTFITDHIDSVLTSNLPSCL